MGKARNGSQSAGLAPVDFREALMKVKYLEAHPR
jgi:hypothetical protein